MSHLAKDDLCESIWEAAQEYVSKELRERGIAWQIPEYGFMQMVEEKYQELLSELLEGTQ